jgi:hypothetical protein
MPVLADVVEHAISSKVPVRVELQPQAQSKIQNGFLRVEIDWKPDKD